MSSQPVYVWSLVLVGVLGIPAVTTIGLYRGVGASGRSRRLAAGVAGVFALLWGGWIVASAALANRGAYAQATGVNRPWIGLAAAGALLAALAGAALPVVRHANAAADGLARLTWPHTLRVVGVAFILAMALGTLPAVFALPAGLGDIAVGIAAPVIARRLIRGDRRGAVWFNLLGVVDLVVAVSLGFLAGLGPSRILAVTPSTADVALLPLALIPTTAVPLALALHLLSLMRLRRATARRPQLAATAA
jgi:hypothetical protein